MSAQLQLLKKYGPPTGGYMAKYCITWAVQQAFPWFPVSHFLVNTDFMPVLFKAFTALQATGIHTEIKAFDGCYNDRDVRGSTSTSLHAWACAIDLNAATNGMIVGPTKEQRRGSWSNEFIAAMKGAGLFYGGDFVKRADPMHWALLDG